MRFRNYFLISALIVFCLTGCGAKQDAAAKPETVTTKEISITSGANEYLGKDHVVVENELIGLGFTNVSSSELQDLESSVDPKREKIATISINRVENFEPGESFPANANVVITYHAVKKIDVPISGDDLQKYDYTELADMLASAGFTKISTNEIVDLDPDSTDTDHLNEVIIDNKSSFGTSDEFPVDADVKIICHKTFAKYTVRVHVDCEENWFLDKHDVDISIGGEKTEHLAHGGKADYEYRFKEGKYTITFTNSEDVSVKSKEEFDVYSDMTIAYKIVCHGSSIDVNTEYTDRDLKLEEDQIKMEKAASEYKGNYVEVIDQIKKLGFVNVKEEPIYDVYTGFLTSESDTESISIKGEKDFKRGDVFSSGDEVIVFYHTSYDKDPNYIAEQKRLEEERAQTEEKAKADAAERASKEAEERQNEINSREYTQYKIQTLENDLESNAASAKNKYYEQYVEVKGKVNNIDSDCKYFTIRDPNNEWDLVGVQCFLRNKEMKEDALNLKKGQTVSVGGKITAVGEIIGYTMDVDYIKR